MFIEDIRNDFYNVLLGNRVLLLVYYDVDAVCTCKILQDLFKCDNISYTLVPVGGTTELKAAYEENNEEIKYVVLVNCGGTLDLVDVLQPEEDVVFFVLDSHKPTDICNVYSDGQVRLLYKDEEENIPNFDDIFRDDEDEEEEEAAGGRDLEATVERRRARKAWEERRHTLMFNYTQFSYYGKPSALVALELAARVSRCGAAAQWAAAAACAAHAALHRRAPARLLLDAEPLHRRVAHHHHHHQHQQQQQREQRRDDDGQGGAQEQAAVAVAQDLWLPLYRCWSLEAALSHSAALAPRLRLHARSGAARLRQLLADVGVPLQQARQAHRAMDVELRRGLVGALGAALPAAARPAFQLRRPHAPPVAALDAAYALMALVEHESLPRAEGFQLALAALEVGGENESLARGIACARRALEAVARVAHSTLAARALLLAGPFSYFIVQEGSPEAAAVRGPLWLGEAARWVAAAAGGARPLLASAPLPGGRCILLGLPPRFDQEPRNLFGAALEQAAARCGAALARELPDAAAVTLPAAHRAPLLDALTALLAAD